LPGDPREWRQASEGEAQHGTILLDWTKCERPLRLQLGTGARNACTSCITDHHGSRETAATRSAFSVSWSEGGKERMNDKTQQFEAMQRMMPMLGSAALTQFLEHSGQVLDTMENA